MNNQPNWQFDDAQTHRSRRIRAFNQHNTKKPSEEDRQDNFELYQEPYSSIHCTVFRINTEHGTKYVTKIGGGHSKEEPLACLEGTGSITNRMYTRDEIIKFACEVCNYNDGDKVWVMYSKPTDGDRFASFENVVEEIVIGQES